MKKIERENRLLASAKLELKKLQSLSDSDGVKECLLERINEKLDKDLVIRDDFHKEGIEVSEILTSRIDDRQSMLEELRSEIDVGQSELQLGADIFNQVIEELRKINPKLAQQLFFLLKKSSKKSRTIVNKQRRD